MSREFFKIGRKLGIYFTVSSGLLQNMPYAQAFNYLKEKEKLLRKMNVFPEIYNRMRNPENERKAEDCWKFYFSGFCAGIKRGFLYLNIRQDNKHIQKLNLIYENSDYFYRCQTFHKDVDSRKAGLTPENSSSICTGINFIFNLKKLKNPEYIKRIAAEIMEKMIQSPVIKSEISRIFSIYGNYIDFYDMEVGNTILIPDKIWNSQKAEWDEDDVIFNEMAEQFINIEDKFDLEDYVNLPDDEYEDEGKIKEIKKEINKENMEENKE